MSSLPAVDLAKGRKFQLSPLSSPKSPANKVTDEYLVDITIITHSK